MTNLTAQSFLDATPPKSPTRYAHLYRRRGGGWELTINSSASLRPCDNPTNKIASVLDPQIFVGEVSGVREARKVAAEFNAVPWNF